MTARTARVRSSKQQKGKAQRETCKLCGYKFKAITAEHLRSHGYTTARYTRMFGVRCSIDGRIDGKSMVPTGSVSDPNADMVSSIATRLTTDKAWVACLADEVGEAMMSGPLRQRLSYMLTTMLSQRAAVHGKALAVLSGALTELQEEWRTTQGGHNSGPTDTDTLLRMVEKAARLVKDSEDAVQRTIKLALDEQKVQAEHASSIGPSLYTGDGERLDMPAGMTTGDRETVRNLLSLIGKAANDAAIIDVTPLPPGGAPPAQVPAPTLDDAVTTLQAPPHDEGNSHLGASTGTNAVTTLQSDHSAIRTMDQSVIRPRVPVAPSLDDPTAPRKRARRRRSPRRPPPPFADDGEYVNDPE